MRFVQVRFLFFCFFFFQAEDGIRDKLVTGVQTCALPIFVVLALVGGAFWVGVFGVLYRILKALRAVEELGPLIPGKILGLILLSFISILVLSNVITALSSFFLAKDLDLLVSAPVDWLRLYLAKLGETLLHSSWMVAL